MPYGCDGYMATAMLFKPSISHNFWRAVETKDFATINKTIQEYDISFWGYLLDLPDSFDAVLGTALPVIRGLEILVR